MWATTGDASAFGGRKKSDCGTGCGTSCNSTVSWVDQKVTAYKTEWDTKDVKVKVNEWVTVKENFKYWECVPETKKQKVTCKEMVTKDVPVKYRVNEWVTTKEKVKVAECKAVTKDVEVTTWSCKPTVTKQKRTVCEWVCVPVVVACAPPACDGGKGGLFSRLCGKKDCTAPCSTACATPCAPTHKTVMQRQKITKEIVVDVTTYEKIATKSMQKVTRYETVWTEKEVDVKKCVAVEKSGMQKVCTWVDVTKEVDVIHYNKVEKTGTRDVKKCVPVEKTVQHKVARQVAYETTVKVAVCTPAPCATPCTTSMSCGSSVRGGLFKSCCGK